MRKILIIFCMFAISSCDHFDEDKEAAIAQLDKDAKQVEENVSSKTMRVADNVRDSIKRTGEHMREWWITPLPTPVNQPVPTRYCYRVLQDILCYRDQMPGWEGKLVAYQGDSAQPPTPATMKVMPLRAENPDAAPAKRAEKAKPVFASMPEEEKETKASEDVPSTISLDATHETLPDSPLAPQL